MSAAGPSAPLRVSAVVLAAGLSRRMGSDNKLLLPVGGQPMVRRCVEVIAAAGVDELVVVLGHQAQDVGKALAPLGVRTVMNPRYETGQVSSVRAGLSALSCPTEAVMMCLGDQPLLTVKDITRLKEAFAQRGAKRIVVPQWGGRRGNPVVIDWASAQATLAGGVNVGCRHFMDDHAEQVLFWEADSEHFVRDVDQLADYQGLEAQPQP